MLGKKRNNRRLIHKKTSDKLSSLKEKPKQKNKDKVKEKKENSEEESINSELASMNDSSSSDNENLENNKIKNKKNDLNINTNIIESYDEKKLRMAKMLLDKFDKDKDNEEKSNSEENSDEEEEEIINKKIIEKYAQEMKNQKINFFSDVSSFSPHESSFIKSHKSTITDISISSSGDLLISSSKDTRAILYDLNKEKKILLPKFSHKSLTCCAFAPDEKSIFFGSKDHYIYQLDIKNYDIIQKIKAHSDTVTGIIFDKIKDQFYSIGNDKILKVWSTDTNPSILLENFYGHTSKINCIKSMPGDINRYITTALDGDINLWKIDSQSFLQFQDNDIYPTDCITPLNNELFFTGNFNGTIKAWKTNKKKSLLKKEFCHGYIEDFNINHNFFDLNLKYKGPEIKIGKPILSLESPIFSDMVISGSIDGEINFYEIQENEGNIGIDTKYTMNIKNKGCLNVIKYCPNKKYIAIGNGCDNKFGRWNKEYDTKLGITIIKLIE